jgi:pyrroline-5-carboxylate reductase
MVSLAARRRILSHAMSIEIGFLGAGHMGRAILEGGLDAGLWCPPAVLVVDRDADRRGEAASFGCSVAEDGRTLCDVPVIVACVRPQDFPDAAHTLRSATPRLVVSVMAGVESTVIADWCGEGSRVVRAMPNAPAAIGRGMTAIAKGSGATADDVRYAKRLFAGVGRTADVDEAQMSAVTAVSGSGPAWVYLLAEAIRSEAIALGLSEETSDTLIRGMVEGAAAMLAGSELSPSALREAVTTPGGTTEAGLAAMRADGFVEAVRAGVAAAARRGEELAQ